MYKRPGEATVVGEAGDTDLEQPGDQQQQELGLEDADPSGGYQEDPTDQPDTPEQDLAKPEIEH